MHTKLYIRETQHSDSVYKSIIKLKVAYITKLYE